MRDILRDIDSSAATTAEQVVDVPEAVDVPNLATALGEDLTKCNLSCMYMYVRMHGKMTIDIDEGDKNGRTPLMIACLCGSLEVVEYLLKLGAGVNTECTQIRNTPLHFLCMCKDNDMFNSPGIYFPKLRSCDDNAVVNKMAIARLLLSNGAVYKPNSLGLTPICYASWYRMEGLANVIEQEMEKIGETMAIEKIKRLEYLGVSRATEGEPMSLAYDCMAEAKQLRQSGEHVCPTAANNRSCEFVRNLFKRNECCSVEAMETLREHNNSIKIEGFLIGARIIPDELKVHYWEALLLFVSLWKDDLTLTLSIISFLNGDAAGIPLENMLDYIEYGITKRAMNSQNLSELSDVMASCFGGLSPVWSEKVNDFGRKFIFNVVVEILTTAVLYSSSESFKSFTATVIHILKLIKEFKPCDYTEQQVVFLPAWTLIDTVNTQIRTNGELGDDAIHQVKYAFAELLHLDCDDASHKGLGGETLLHRALYLINCRSECTDKELEIILGIIRMIIRHGCDVGTGNNVGITAKDLAVYHIKTLYPNYKTEHSMAVTGFERLDHQIVMFVDALSAPSYVLPLEELAARVVLQRKIPYRDHLPSKLHDRVLAGF